MSDTTSLRKTIKSECAAGYQLYDEKDYAGALRVFYQAWLKLPKPQSDHEESGWVLAAIGDTYYQLKRWNQAAEALNSCLHCPKMAEVPFVHLRLGQVLYEHKELIQARQNLHKAYQIGGSELFESEPDKYLNAIADLINR
jgi:tetratricopeptide (TPR) repeat protein